MRQEKLQTNIPALVELKEPHEKVNDRRKHHQTFSFFLFLKIVFLLRQGQTKRHLFCKKYPTNPVLYGFRAKPKYNVEHLDIPSETLAEICRMKSA